MKDILDHAFFGGLDLPASRVVSRDSPAKTIHKRGCILVVARCASARSANKSTEGNYCFPTDAATATATAALLPPLAMMRRRSAAAAPVSARSAASPSLATSNAASSAVATFWMRATMRCLMPLDGEATQRSRRS